MCSTFLKSILIITASLLLSPTIYAQDASNQDKVFQDACNKAWMEKAGTVSDKTAFQTFGEKYCGCATGKNLTDDAALKQAAHTCMAQTILRDAMDTLQNKPGLQNLTEDQIVTGCKDKWALVYTDMTSDVRTSTTNYCLCAGPKLNKLNNTGDKLSDKQWYDQINVIADQCSGNSSASSQ